MSKAFLIGLIFIFPAIENLTNSKISISNEYLIQPNKIRYKIIKKEKDNRGLTNQLYVYIIKKADIKAVNKILFDEYRKTGIASLQIFYFDNEQVTKTYSTKVFDKNISDEEIDKMSKHVTGKFVYLAINNTQSLHIGSDADMY